MRIIFLIVFLNMILRSNSQPAAENLIIITTDGFRWQEVFKGMDSAIANNSKYNQGDSAGLFKAYWSDDVSQRRKKLLPFLWGGILAGGQVYGNRDFGNKVDNNNPHWFSYPGYSEIMTGYVDTAINSNDYPGNPYSNVLEFLNHQPKYKGKVAAFTSWIAFDSILNEPRSEFPVISAFDAAGGKKPDDHEKLINAMNRDSYKPFGKDECLDVFTHYEALECLQTKRPKVLFISYGETDEWAHAGKYFSYLEAAHQVDAWIRQLWEWVQSDPGYRNKTAIFITTDHGRGDLDKDQWRSHNNKVPDSHEIWFAVMGPGIPVKGEIKTGMQLYQQQFAQSFAKILRYKFTANHPVAEAVPYIFNTTK